MWVSGETSPFPVQLTRRTGMLCILSALGHMEQQWSLETAESLKAHACRGHATGQAPRHQLPMSRSPAGGFQEGRRTHRKEGAGDESSVLTEALSPDRSLVRQQRKALCADLAFSFSGLNVSRICSVRLPDQTHSPRTLLIPHIRGALGLPGALSCCPAICEYP